MTEYDKITSKIRKKSLQADVFLIQNKGKISKEKESEVKWFRDWLMFCALLLMKLEDENEFSPF